MDERTRAILQRPFDKKLIKQRMGPGGKQLSYVEISHYLARLNEAFGHDWSLEIVRREQYEDQLIVEVKVSALNIVKMGLGGASIRRRTEDGRILSLADDFKAAEADAIKRAARLMGVGAELYLDPPELLAGASSSRAPFSGAGQSAARNGRATSAQLAKLKELVGELGSDWTSFRDWVRETHGLSIEYGTRSLASGLIDDLLRKVRARRGANGGVVAGNGARR